MGEAERRHKKLEVVTKYIRLGIYFLFYNCTTSIVPFWCLALYLQPRKWRQYSGHTKWYPLGQSCSTIFSYRPLWFLPLLFFYIREHTNSHLIFKKSNYNSIIKYIIRNCITKIVKLFWVLWKYNQFMEHKLWQQNLIWTPIKGYMYPS